MLTIGHGVLLDEVDTCSVDAHPTEPELADKKRTDTNLADAHLTERAVRTYSVRGTFKL
jgi:hypothetical protein